MYVCQVPNYASFESRSTREDLFQRDTSALPSEQVATSNGRGCEKIEACGLIDAALSPAFVQESLECFERFFADVVLDAFGVDAGLVFADAQREECRVDDIVPGF